MFEIDDPKLGKIKFINITEARAQIAAITQDKECSYVLTKNNKPIRVIVNYDLFHQWQQQEVSRTDSKPFDKSILQGLLEGREQDLKKTVVSKLQEEWISKNMPLSSSVADTSMAPPQEDILADPLPSLDIFPESSPDYFSEIPLETMPEASVALPSSVKEEAVPLPPKESAPLSPEEQSRQDYYARFRKLYESAPAHQAAKSKSASSYFDPQTSFESSYSRIKVEPAGLIKPEKTTQAESAATKSKSSADIPSIQDLLKELEGEPLSDEQSPPSVGDLLKKLS